MQKTLLWLYSKVIPPRTLLPVIFTYPGNTPIRICGGKSSQYSHSGFATRFNVIM